MAKYFGFLVSLQTKVRQAHALATTRRPRAGGSVPCRASRKCRGGARAPHKNRRTTALEGRTRQKVSAKRYHPPTLFACAMYVGRGRLVLRCAEVS